MLLSTSDSFKANKKNQYTLRRKARNLRAKVKALLPIQICSRHDHRNRCVEENEQNQKIWLEYFGKNQWALGKQSEQKHYYEKKGCEAHGQRFQKLCEKQIEQIKEDRLYYLGEENLKDFEEFLQERDKSDVNSHKNQSLLKKSALFLNFEKDKREVKKFRQSHGPFTNIHKSQQIDCESMESSYVKIRQNIAQNNAMRFKQFDERRKIIEVQSKSKRLLEKVKLNVRLEKAQQKLKQIQTLKVSELENRRHEREEVLRRVTHRQKNKTNKGQIKLLQQQLRRTFLNRMARGSHCVRSDSKRKILA